MEKLKELFAQSRTRTALIIGVLVVALAVPITMRLVSQQQDLRQRANVVDYNACLSQCSLDPDDPTMNEYWEVAECRNDCDDQYGDEVNPPPECGGWSCEGNDKVRTCVNSDGQEYTERVQDDFRCADDFEIPDGDDDSSSSTCGDGTCSIAERAEKTLQCNTGGSSFCSQDCGSCPADDSSSSCTSYGCSCDSDSDCASNLECNSGSCDIAACDQLSGRPDGCSCIGDSQCSGDCNNFVCESSSSGGGSGGSGGGGGTQPVGGDDDDDSCDGLNKPVGCICEGDSSCASGDCVSNRCVSSTPTNTPIPTSAPTSAPTATPTPTGSANSACGNNCTTDFDCREGGSCGKCTGSLIERLRGNGVCADQSPTPTGDPACGSSCDTNSDCAGASGSCTVCQDLGGDSKQCTTAPTATPTPTTTITPTTTPVVACGTSCDTDSACASAKDGCTICAPNSQRGGNTCQRNGVSPTPTDSPDAVGLQVNLQMPGIGQNTGDNSSPLNPNRTTTAIIFNSDNERIGDTTGTTQFDGTDTYRATLSSTQVPEGVYYLQVKFDNTLVTRIPGVVDLQAGQTVNTPTTTLIPGDLDQNNVLDIIDYNIFVDCYGAKTCSAKSLSDFNDDGDVGSVDYNILLRSFAIRQGD